jgi:uncharacterized protein YbjT (DUF2867 family)
MTGATGFIGGALARALLAQGHDLVCAVREPSRLQLPGGRWQAIACDLAQVPGDDFWRPHLQGVDAVVNAVGILREAKGQTFDALHARAPIALFEAASRAGVPVVIQVSALGADEGAQSRYHRSKKQADDCLRRLPVAGTVVQPSAVYGPGSDAAAMFNMMSALPLLAMPQSGRMLMQPVHVDDVVAGLLALLAAPPKPVATVAFVGPRALTMAGYLRELRAARGNRWPLPVLWMPTFAFMAVARVAGLIPGSVLDAETAGMLLRGNEAPADDFQRLLGRAPRSVAEFLQPGPGPG